MTITSIIPKRPLHWSDLVYQLQELLTNDEVYLVGGIIRDVYLGRPIHDIDLVSAEDGRPIARRIANALGGDYYALDSERGVGRALIDWQNKSWTVDVAQFRGADLAEDLADRDFTINAMAVDLQDLDRLLDPLHGEDDLVARLVRLCSPESITHDPVRALRAIRISIELQLRLTPEAKNAIRQDGRLLKQVSDERIRDEFWKILGGKKPMSALILLESLDLLALILPETSLLKELTQSPPHLFDAWRHTLHVVDFMGRILQSIGEERTDATAANFALGMIAYSFADLRPQLQQHLRQPWPNERSHRALLIFAALAHDTGKPLTHSEGDDGRIHFYGHEYASETVVKQWGRLMALSNDEIVRLQAIVRHHMRPLQLSLQSTSLSRRAQYRFWREAGVAGIDVCLLTMADYLGKRGGKVEQQEWIDYLQMIHTLLEGYYRQSETLVNITPLVDGNTLMSRLELSPGPVVGQLIAALHEAQALQQIQSPEEALTWAKVWLADRTEHDISD
jgi:tRNA nucleotidyltransferase/poly(A) polymerase